MADWLSKEFKKITSSWSRWPRWHVRNSWCMLHFLTSFQCAINMFETSWKTCRCDSYALPSLWIACLRVALTLVHGWWALSFPASALDVSSGPGRCVALWCNSMMLSGAIQPRTLVDLYMQTADLDSKEQNSNVTNDNLSPQPWTIGYRKLRSSGPCTLSVVFLLGCKRNQNEENKLSSNSVRCCDR